jgi:hypothetical protein
MRDTRVSLRGAFAETRQYAPVFRYLLTPVALTGYVLAFWRLAADLGWTSDFFISRGPLSRWQVWLALAVATQFGARELQRVKPASGDATPQAEA